ncbi:MAG: glycerol-3-phosphate 1-O-acyltransferase PlsY [Burkholderiales bacterium]
MNPMVAAAFVIAAYLIGSLSFAVIVSRAFSLPDPRSYGSGNPGATNVLRTGRKLAALLTLLGDGGKGWLAVFLATRYAPDYGVDAAGVATCAIAVFLGHVFPAFFRFAGGKGVATAGGILFAINPWLGAATLATWAIIALFFRYSSLAAVSAAGFAPLYAFFLFGMSPALPAVILISALLVWRHKNNIVKLIAGKEDRIGEKQDSAGP